MIPSNYSEEFHLKHLLLSLLLLSASSKVWAAYTYGFDDINTTTADGWVQTNNSAPLGQFGWFQGTTLFAAHSGAADSYIAASYQNTDLGNISNWLISPMFTFTDGDVLTFFTRTEPGAPFPDNLELRLSTNGNSSDVGFTDTSLGDFTTLLLAVNPSLTVGGYPEDWTVYSVVLSGLGVAKDGRFAFRYAVPDTNTNGDFIGIDTVSLTSASDTPEPGSWALVGVGITTLGFLSRRNAR